MNDERWLRLRSARGADLDEIVAIERTCFPTPWPRIAFIEELARRKAEWVVAVCEERVVGYAGMWCVAGEAHVMNVAVDPDWRRRGIGEALVLRLLEVADGLDADLAYLEHRETNHVAGGLYANLGFVPVGRRRGYYRDTKEDAILMVLQDLPRVVSELVPDRWRRWRERYGDRPAPE